MNPESGISPSVLFGQLPRLAGADATLYPSAGAYAMSAEECRLVAQVTGESWGPLKPIFPTAAGRMSVDRIGEMCAFYGKEVIFIAGSSIQRQDGGLVHAGRRFVQEISRSVRNRE